MYETDSLQDTIIAPASGRGGAVTLIRLSGKELQPLLLKHFRSAKPLCHAHALYGHMVDGEKLIDEVVLTYFQAPHSYTGEDTAEIGCHASPISWNVSSIASSKAVRAWQIRANSRFGAI